MPEEKPKRKPGPSKRLPAMEKHTVLIERRMAEWAKSRPVGMSGTVREALQDLAKREGLE
jgi:hypothetical protein